VGGVSSEHVRYAGIVLIEDLEKSESAIFSPDEETPTQPRD
jgi:hypothetical protein